MDLKNHIYDACTVKFAAATAGSWRHINNATVSACLATSGNAATLEIRLIEELKWNF